MTLRKVDSPEEAGFSRAGLRNAADVLVGAVEEGIVPGGVATVGRGGKLVMEYAFGSLAHAEEAPAASSDTIYDVASLTKVVVTTTLAMILFEEGKLDLDARVREHFPDFVDGEKDRVTILDLLTHSSGILWWKDLYRSVQEDWPIERVKEWYVNEIVHLPLDYVPRTKSVYSDLGIILLGDILEQVAGQRLDELARNWIFSPLGMKDSRFRPPTSLRKRIAPTGKSPWRDRVLVGEVYDDNAFALGGVAPHAGLFATGSDLARFAQTMLNGGSLDGRRIVEHSTVELFTRKADGIPGSSRALGWDTPSPDSTAGRYFSFSSYGHLGFTGTSLWCDPTQNIFVVLLSNRVRLSQDRAPINSVRASFHDAVMEALLDVPPLRSA